SMGAALYTKVSASNGQSPDMQLAELREYVTRRRGWKISGEYVDHGIQGRSLRKSRIGQAKPENPANTQIKLVGAIGFEPTTPCAQGRCATRLRYAPTLIAFSILNYLSEGHHRMRLNFCHRRSLNFATPRTGVSSPHRLRRKTKPAAEAAGQQSSTSIGRERRTEFARIP